MKIAAAYIRVSTEDQTELSPDSQIKLIREYAKSNDYILPEEYIYRDDGISGRKVKNRPAFTAMIGAAKTKPKPFDSILVWKFSRFARNREDSIVYKSMLKKQGIDVISISEPVGDDKMSVLMEAMIEAMDEYYSLNLSEEVTRGFKERLSRGKNVGAPAIGYAYKNGTIYIDEEKAETVRRIYAEYLDGKPLLRIIRELNAEGITTASGAKFSKDKVLYILSNPIYCGKLRDMGDYSIYGDRNRPMQDGIHEAIISEEQWRAVQDIMYQKHQSHAKYQRDSAVKHELMLRGLLRCSSCGALLTKLGKGYQCYRYTEGSCDKSHFVTIHKIDEAVIKAICNADFSTELNIKVREPKAPEISDITEKLLQRERIKLTRIKEAYTSGIDTLEEYKANKAKITEQIARLEAQKSKTPANNSRESIIKRLEDRRGEFMKLLRIADTPQAELNSALHTFIEKIVYDKESETITIFYAV